MSGARASDELVLLPGWGMNSGVWGGFADRLGADYRLTLLDLPGHGKRADMPPPRTLRGWAEACLDVAPAGAVWVGWSLGAQVALRAALDAPQRMRGLVLIAGTPRFVQASDWASALDVAVFRQFADALLADDAATLERFLALQVRGADDARQTLRTLRAAVAHAGRPAKAGLEAGLRLLLETDLRDELPLLACRSLWLFGEQDTLVPARLAADVATLLPGAQTACLPGCAHAPFLSDVDGCARLLDGFLRQAAAA